MRRCLRVFGLTALLALPSAASAAAQASSPAPELYSLASASLPDRVSQDDSSRNRTKGALWGAGIGLVGGGLLGGLTAGSEEEDDGFGEGPLEATATASSVILGAVIGAGVGALLGATVFAPHRQSSALTSAVQSIRVGPHRLGDGLGATVGVRWHR